MPPSYGPPKVCFCKYIVSVDNNISKIKKNKNVRLCIGEVCQESTQKMLPTI